MSDYDFEPLDPTIQELLLLESMQWIFVGGKGGVGKTTTSCSLAIQLAKTRESVLIISTDPAHNLSDAFGQKFRAEPTLVNGIEGKNLFAMEIDTTKKADAGYVLEDANESGGGFMGLGNLSKTMGDLVQSFPGIDEALSFAQLMQSVQNMNFSTIVFDTAPTGHTLRLLSFPDLLERAFQSFSDPSNGLGNIMEMMNSMGGMMGGEGASGGVTSQLSEFRAITRSIKDVFEDPTRTTFVCVCIPEFLSVYETERLIQELMQFGIDASYVVVNQIVFPVDGEDGSQKALSDLEANLENIVPEQRANVDSVIKRLKALETHHRNRRAMQSKYLNTINDLYSEDYHVVPMPLRGNEVRGIALLESFGKDLLTVKKLPILEADE